MPSTKVRQNPTGPLLRMMSNTYADNHPRSNSDSSSGIAGRGVAMQATGLDLSNMNYHRCNNFGHYKNVCAEFKAVYQQISDADNGSTSNEVDISHISRSRGGSCSRGEGGECSAHTRRPRPIATPIAAPGRQTASTATPILPMSVLRVFLGSAARGISLCQMTLTRSSASHSWREKSSLRPSPPKLEWRRSRGHGYSAQSGQQRRRSEELAPDHLLRVLSRQFPLGDR